MSGFFSCFSCDNKSASNVVTPEKPTVAKDKQQYEPKGKEDSYVEDDDRAKTVTTATFHHSQLNDDEEEISRVVEKLKKKTLPQRKSFQSDFVRKNLGSHPVMYLVENRWSEEYTEFLNDPAKHTMRQINNRILMDGKYLALGLREKVDFYPVTRKVWLFLKKLYGGGPDLHKNNWLPILDIPIGGIKNNKYFCYLNTGIQTLFSIGQFSHYFYTKSFNSLKFQTKSQKKPFSNCTSRTLKLFLDSTTGRQLTQLTELLEQKFSKNQQQDCHQFLRIYLEHLQDELNPVSTKKPLVCKTSDDSYSQYLSTHNSIVDLLFAGQMTNLTKCGGCQNISLVHDPFMQLFIDIHKNDLEASLQRHFSIEKLSDLYECDRCHSKNKAVKQLFISKSPAYLLITIKRFAKKKISDVVEYPEKLNLEKYTKYNAGKCQYYLHSIIIHKGTLEKGHYYCICRRAKKWYYLNDEKVAEVGSKDVFGQQAYILVYEREK